MLPLFSIIVASNRPDNLLALFDNLEETCSDPRFFEVLVKADSEDESTCALLADEAEKRPFSIRAFISPRNGGYYELHHFYQQMLADVSSETYFVVVFSDEVRFKTKGWDDVLRGYVGYFPDDIFRLRISDNKFRQYDNLYECSSYPENFAITTKAWYLASEGMGDFWGPDSWHQVIEFYLSRMPGDDGFLSRGIPVAEIQMTGISASIGESLPSVFDKVRRSEISWRDLTRRSGQEDFLRRAARLAAKIRLSDLGDVEDQISENPKTKMISVGSGAEISYHVSYMKALSAIVNRLFHVRKNGMKSLILSIVLEFPASIRIYLENIVCLILSLTMKARINVFYGGAYYALVNSTLKQVHLIEKRTNKVLRVSSYRLLLSRQ